MTEPDKPNRHQPLGDWREHAMSLGKAVAYKLWSIHVLPALVIGAALLSAAIGFGRDLLDQRSRMADLTGRGSAMVEAAWWRLDFDPAELDGGTAWTAVTAPTFCARLVMVTPQPGPSAVACLHYGQILNPTVADYQLQNLPSSRTTDPSIPWRDAHGRLALELHVPAAAWDWLTSEEAFRPFVPEWSPPADPGGAKQWSEWAAFRARFERPADDLVELWQLSPAVPVAFAPDDATQMVPSVFLDQREYQQILPFVAAAGVFGAIFWSVGIRLLLFDMARRWRLLVIVATLACSPWWGNWIWHGLDLMLDHASDLGKLLENEVIPRPPTPEILAATYAGEAGDHRETYSLESSVYAPLFEGMELTAPPAPLAEAAALAEAQAQVTAAIAAMTPEDRLLRFARLACYAAADFRAAGKLFLPAAGQWLEDPDIGPIAERFVDYQQDSGYPSHGLDCDAAMP